MTANHPPNGFELGYISILPNFICILGVISHVLLIIAFVKDPLKCFKNSGTYLVGNLAVSDLLTCLIGPVFQYCTPTEWYWTIQPVLFAPTAVSVLTISSISLDRFLMVVYPMKHRVFMKGKVIIVWSACIWLISFIYPTKAFLLSTSSDTDQITIHFGVVVVIIFAGLMYGFTYYKLKNQSRNFALENVSNRQQQARVMKEKRFLRTIILIACIAVVCVVPSTIFYSYAVVQKLFIDGLAARILNGICGAMFYINFAVNPMVYVLRLPNYRKTFYLLYWCKPTAR